MKTFIYKIGTALDFALALALIVALGFAASRARADVLDDDSKLIGGTPADPKDWPASVYASMSGASCSATVVGPKTLLIAAHCVSNGGTASFAVGTNAYTSRCTHSPDYRRDDTADWALCLVDKPVLGIPYERLVESGDWCAAGKQVRLTGYGCIRAGGGGGNDGIYRIGYASVLSCPSRDNDIVARGAAALCYGDSGGPAFIEYEDGTRELISVNSRGDIRTTSYLSAVFTAKARSFIASWSQANGQKICGIHVDAEGCRGGDTPPSPGGDCKSAFADYESTLSLAAGKFQVLKACVEDHQ